MVSEDSGMTRRGLFRLSAAAIGGYLASQIPFNPVYAAGDAPAEPRQSAVKPIPRVTKYMLAATEDAATAYEKAIGALKERHGNPEILVFRGKEIEEVEREISAEKPTHVQVVCTPEEASIPGYTGRVEDERSLSDGTLPVRLGKMLNRLGNGYRGAIGGILTAYTPEDALRIAQQGDFEVDNPLLIAQSSVHKNAEIFDAYRNSAAYLEAEKGYNRKDKSNGAVTRRKVERAGTDILESLNSNTVGMFSITGHGGANNWAPARTGEQPDSVFIARNGRVYLADLASKTAIGVLETDNPKVFWGAGTCRVGSVVDKDDSLLLGLLGSGGFTQAFGYETVTWYGRMGWSLVADYLLNFPESSWFEAHRRAEIGLQFTLNKLRKFRRENKTPVSRDEQGHAFDTDVFIGWGDCGTRATNLLDDNFHPFYSTTIEPRVDNGRRVVKVGVKANEDGVVGTDIVLGNPIVVDLKEDVSGYRISAASPGLDCDKGMDFVVLHPRREIINGGDRDSFRFSDIRKGDSWFVELSSQ